MAKESMKARDKKRARLVEQYATRRAELKKALLAGDPEAMKKLQELPKNSTKVRKRNRCQITGRPRGYMRQFGVSRIVFREMALNGKIPGVTKASW
jgi:small subunit ribosomal protein S14